MFYYMKQWLDCSRICTPFLILKPEGKGNWAKETVQNLDLCFPDEFYDEATGETYKGYKEEGYLPEAFVNFLALWVGPF